jgi:hypothetical protein
MRSLTGALDWLRKGERSPSGSVHAYGDAEYDSLEAWEKAFRERWNQAKPKQESKIGGAA